MADHLSQSNTKSAIEHEERAAAEECIMYPHLWHVDTLYFTHGDSTGMEDLIWHLEGDPRGGDFINVIEQLDLSQ